MCRRPQDRKVLDVFEELEGGQHVIDTERGTPEECGNGRRADLALYTHLDQEKPLENINPRRCIDRCVCVCVSKTMSSWGREE